MVNNDLVNQAYAEREAEYKRNKEQIISNLKEVAEIIMDTIEFLRNEDR